MLTNFSLFIQFFCFTLASLAQNELQEISLTSPSTSGIQSINRKEHIENKIPNLPSINVPLPINALERELDNSPFSSVTSSNLESENSTDLERPPSFTWDLTEEQEEEEQEEEQEEGELSDYPPSVFSFDQDSVEFGN